MCLQPNEVPWGLLRPEQAVDDLELQAADVKPLQLVDIHLDNCNEWLPAIVLKLDQDAMVLSFLDMGECAGTA